MKLVRFNDWSTGILIERDPPEVIDVAASISPHLRLDGITSEQLRPLVEGRADWAGLITNWTWARAGMLELRELGESGDRRLVTHSLSTIAVRPPLTSVRARIFGLAGNWASHTSRVETVRQKRNVTAQEIETDKMSGKPPWGFHVMPESVVGSGSMVTPPRGTEKLDYEAEVAAVIGTSGRYVNASEIVIWGFTGWNDLSIRDPHFGLGPKIDAGPLVWALQKNFDTGNACGPWMSVDEPHDPHALRMQTRVNGEVRQSGSTKDMLFTFEEVAAFLSTYFTIRVGDMFASGTPSGTGFEGGVNGPFLRPGDVVEVEIEGVGVLRNQVAAP